MNGTVNQQAFANNQIMYRSHLLTVFIVVAVILRPMSLFVARMVWQQNHTIIHTAVINETAVCLLTNEGEHCLSAVAIDPALKTDAEQALHGLSGQSIRTQDGLMYASDLSIEEILLLDGMARIQSNDTNDVLIRAQTKAQQSRRGTWHGSSH